MGLFKSKEEKAQIAAGRAVLENVGKSGVVGVEGARQLTKELGSNSDILALSAKEKAILSDAAFVRFAELALTDDLLTEDEEDALLRLGTALGIDQASLETRHLDLTHRLMVARINDGRLPVVSDPQLMAKKDEMVHMEVPAELMKEVTVREFRGGYSGVSFRVAKGVRFHTGGMRGRSVVLGKELQVADTGILAISSRRAVFMGRAKTVEFAYPKFVSMDVFLDAVRMHVSNRQTASLIRVDAGEVVAAMLNAAIQNAV